MTRAPGMIVTGHTSHRACRNCVQIKVKCVPLQDGSQNICQRCHRLKKECITPVPVVRKQRTKNTKVKQLEDRVNELSALLTPAQSVVEDGSHRSQQLSDSPVTHNIQSAAGSNVPAAAAPTPPFPEDSRGTTDVVGSWTADMQPIARSGSPSMFIPHAPGRKDGSHLLNEPFCPVYLEEEFERRIFAEFRNNMLPECPFVVINPDVTAAVFKEKRPFSYWACIYSGAYRYRMLQQTLNDELMKALGHRMLVNASKSVDLLQGLLIMIGWHHYISHYSPNMMILLHLCQALLVDLGVAKPVRAQDKLRIVSDTAAMVHGTDSITLNVSADEKRALLGCYFMTSKAALTFNRLDPMRYTQHTDDMCKDLKLAAEYESDILLIELVQLHRIFGKYLQLDSGPAISTSIYRNMFRDEIQRYKQNLPSSLQGNPLIETEILSNSLCFLEPSYAPDNGDDIDRLNALHACVDTGNQMMDIILAFSPQKYPSLIFSFTMSLIEYMVIFCRLSLFKSENWDSQYARRTADVRGTLERLKNFYQDIHQYEISTLPNYTPWRYAIYVKKAEHIIAWLDMKVASEEADTNPPDAFGENLFGNLDDPTWHELMGNWIDY